MAYTPPTTRVNGELITASIWNTDLTANITAIHDIISVGTATELTISAGAITITGGQHTVDTEGDAASDDLDTINGGISSNFVLLRAENTARTVVIKNATGNIHTIAGNDVTLDDIEKAALIFFDGTNWLVIGDGTGAASTFYQTIQDAGTPVTQRPTFNFVDGSNATVTVADDAGNNRTNITVAASTTIDASATQHINLVKNYPSFELADGSQPEWWEESGSGTLTEEDATGEGIAQKYERVIKFVVSGGGGGTDYVYQQYDVSAEPSLDASVSNISAGAWVYVVSSGVVTMDLRDTVGGSLGTTDATTTTDAWEFLQIENETLGANDLELRFTGDTNSMIFYIAIPMLNIGPTLQAWRPRALVPRYEVNSDFVNGVDPGGGSSFINVDVTSITSPLAVAIQLIALYQNSTTASVLYSRRNGEAAGTVRANLLVRLVSAVSLVGIKTQLLDDGQIFQYATNAGGGDAETLYLSSDMYWEWES
jgi:hypothetical protein